MATPTRVACLLLACAAAPVTVSSAISGCVVHEEVEASGEVVVAHEPPPDRPEEAGAAPGAEYVWIRGRWLYSGSDWVWRRGHWEVRRVGHEWVPGHWVRRDGGWLWVEGHWRRL
jgi:hypothetical protein